MIERLSFDDWRAFDAAHPAPTFFARPAWALALAQAQPWMTPAPLQIRVGAGRTILVPLMQMAGGKLRWREFCAFPLGGYTCFMYEDGTLATPGDCDRAMAAIARYADTATVIPWPLAAGPRSHAGPEHEAAVVYLKDGLDAALSNVAGIFRRMAGQAQRRGVECSPSNDPSAVDDYYRLLELSAMRWGIGKPTIPKALIAGLVAHGGADVEMWFARAEGANIGGGVVFYGAQELFFWSAAMDAEYGRLRPSNALNWALLHAAAARGMLYYNLGSSEGLPGVAKFKENLGARDVSYHEIKAARTPYKLYSRVRSLVGATS